MSSDKPKDVFEEVFDNFINRKNSTNNDSLKEGILDNLDIANRMFDKYNDFIFSDNDLKAKAKELHMKLNSYSD